LHLQEVEGCVHKMKEHSQLDLGGYLFELETYKAVPGFEAQVVFLNASVFYDFLLMAKKELFEGTVSVGALIRLVLFHELVLSDLLFSKFRALVVLLQ